MTIITFVVPFPPFIYLNRMTMKKRWFNIFLSLQSWKSFKFKETVKWKQFDSLHDSLIHVACHEGFTTVPFKLNYLWQFSPQIKLFFGILFLFLLIFKKCFWKNLNLIFIQFSGLPTWILDWRLKIKSQQNIKC